MKSGNLFNLIRDRVTTSQLNSIYTLVTGINTFTESGADEPDVNPAPLVFNTIQCGWTACRLQSADGEIPSDIERCQ